MQDLHNHNLKFCPKCGEKSLLLNSKKWNCKECDFTLYQNSAAAVAVLFSFENQILFTVRNREPSKGKLDLPGGFVDPNERAEETCVREIKEELGLDIDINQLKYLNSIPNVYPYKDICYHTLDLFFEYRVDRKFDVELALSEISQVIWVDVNQLEMNEIAFESQKLFFKNYKLEK